jgi:lipid-A-disaccharide synthase-like uncharacterized protein
VFAELLDKFDLLFICLGLPAQTLFTCRFAVQWYVSEKQGKSVIPLSFWYLSLGGSIGLCTYGLLRSEPILVFGQLFNCIIYCRNLMLIRKNNKNKKPDDQEKNGPEESHAKRVCLN